MTLLTYTGLVLTLATIHEYVPYKSSTMLIIAVVITIPGFRHYCSIWTLYFIALVLLGGIIFIVLYIASISSYSIKYWMISKIGIGIRLYLVAMVSLSLASSVSFSIHGYRSSIWTYLAYFTQLTWYSMCGYMAVLVLTLSLILILVLAISSSYMPIREF